MTAFWYHFAILFEALFILTTVDAGTRVAPLHDPGPARPFRPRPWRGPRTGAPTCSRTALAVAGWGYFLYQGVVDPLGGINTLWPLFGISNQMLAAIALILCTAVLFKMKRERYAAITIGADGLADHLHADRRLGEAVRPRSGDRLLGRRRQIFRRRSRRARCWRRPRPSRRCIG